MAEEQIRLVPSAALVPIPSTYTINFTGYQRRTGGVTYRLGENAFSGPVALKTGADPRAGDQLRRELDVSRFLGGHGGELLSKCLGYDFGNTPMSALVTYRGRPLADLVRDESNWPPDNSIRTKMITDLLQGVELLHLSSIVHGAISMNTLHWDGNTLQIVDFGHAALCGTYPDGRPARHGDDIQAVSRVVYHVYTGQPPPSDPVALRHQIEHVQDPQLRDLLLRRDLVTGIDFDYAFSPDDNKLPTARMLLDRLDRRPRGVQWQQLVTREEQTRKDFQRLREQQQDFRDVYLPWAAESARAASRFWWPTPPQFPFPLPAWRPDGGPVMGRRPWPLVAVVFAIAAVAAVAVALWVVL